VTLMSMLQVMELEGVKYKKYVLQNAWTGIVIDQRFWTVRGARRRANKNVNSLNKAIRGLNKRYGKV
jgi:hypothetical protein